MPTRFVSLLGTAGHIRSATYQGQPVLVVPVVALVSGVLRAMNAPCAEFVPVATLAAAPQSWNGRPVMLGHPGRNGQQISANDPEVLEAHSFGTIFNARVEGAKLLLDAYLEPTKAERIGAGRLLQRLRAGEIVNVSVGAFVTTRATPGASHNGKPYEAEWISMSPDHIAILEHSVGACSTFDGCGTRAAEGVKKTEAEWRQHFAEKLGCGTNEVPDGYAAHLPRPPCPRDDPAYQPFGEPADGYTLALDRAKKETQ
ncbi:MAG: DUF2213 domain-containing protein [Acidobacteria bacterium]|nr:DUF2213 domain-containing protein [Acidobacteriota bacterium]